MPRDAGSGSWTHRTRALGRTFTVRQALVDVLPRDLRHVDRRSAFGYLPVARVVVRTRTDGRPVDAVRGTPPVGSPSVPRPGADALPGVGAGRTPDPATSWRIGRVGRDVGRPSVRTSGRGGSSAARTDPDAAQPRGIIRTRGLPRSTIGDHARRLDRTARPGQAGLCHTLARARRRSGAPSLGCVARRALSCPPSPRRSPTSIAGHPETAPLGRSCAPAGARTTADKVPAGLPTGLPAGLLGARWLSRPPPDNVAAGRPTSRPSGPKPDPQTNKHQARPQRWSTCRR